MMCYIRNHRFPLILGKGYFPSFIVPTELTQSYKFIINLIKLFFCNEYYFKFGGPFPIQTKYDELKKMVLEELVYFKTPS